MSASELPDETLFEGALNCRTPADRAAYLDQACAGRPELRRELEKLLDANDASGGFLEPAAGVDRPTVTLEIAPEETSGTRIGRYKVLQRIGEGGMGVVYMAEQTEPVVRKVALKIIKLGMDTRQVVARFEAERQALALMDHPNIARVLDAGATEAGRPYFVMELVHGVPITEYCDRNRLTTRERLELFIPVCQAIQHAHQKGIIHRDIKPSNVMVTLHDGVPVPKVIDFGVAKATNQRLTEKTLFTNYATLIGTPAYMSPEQAELSGLDIDTRSDIYSLGVLLYELLTGVTPFDAKALLHQGYAEMQRIIAQEEPSKPSTRLSTMQREERTAVAMNRRVDAGALRRGFQGDLDWIVMKCLEKDRTRRYETSSGLATDLQRHLGHETVTARPATAGYRLARLVRRNKLLFAAMGSVGVALVMGIGVSRWQAVRADREAGRARRAEAQARERLAESEAIARFLQGVFESPDPSRDGRHITVAETLDKAARKLETDLTTQPARRAYLRSILGTTYLGMGLPRDGLPLLEKARDYYVNTLGREHATTIAVLQNLASALADVGRLGEAHTLYEEVAELSRRVKGARHRETIGAMINLAKSYGAADFREKALKMEEEILALATDVFGPKDPLTLTAMINLATSYREVSRSADSLRLREQALPLCREVFGSRDPTTLVAAEALAFALYEDGRRDEAIQREVALRPLFETVFGPEHPRTIAMMRNLATVYFGDQRLYFGEDQSEKALRRRADFEKALQMREELVLLAEKVNGSKHPATLDAIDELGESYWSLGLKEKAITQKERLLTLRREVLGPERTKTLGTMLNLAYCYRENGQIARAIEQGEAVLESFQRVLGATHGYSLNAMTELSISYGADDRLADAIALEEKALRLKREHLPAGHGWVLESLNHLATCYEQAGRNTDAQPLRRELVEWQARAEAAKSGKAAGASPGTPAAP